ncbi:MAG: LysM peptidoglycan-binding domain-containing protein [Anaerolineales bacterium]|nr:LysM peptidoglycan-binding domain-containing protein [Anaerolineales bacterium]
MKILFVSLSVIALLLCGCGQVITVSTPTPVATPPVNLPAVTPRSTSTPAPSTPGPTLPPTPAPTPVIHKVQAGDTISGIAKQYGISAEALQEANAILDPQLLQIDQELVIPLGNHNPEGPPTSTPIPLPFEVKGVGFYETPAGSLWCLGEVENTSGRALERVQVKVSLQDEDDKVLATESAFVALGIVPQRSKAPFAVLFVNPPVSFAKYQAIPLSGEAVTYLGNRYLDLTVTEQQGESEGHYFAVEGLVQNTGQADAETVTVLATAYDAHGRVTGFRQADLENAPAAGESFPFQVNLLPFGGTAVTYSVQAQGTRLE